MTPKPARHRSAAPERASGSARASSATALLVSVVVFLVCAVVVMPYMPDDSFISFRYAEHLASGHGLTFNIGDAPVEAYSTLLWILVCALLYKAGFSLPQVTPWFGILLGAGSLWLLWTLHRRRAPLWTRQLPPLLVLASCGPFVIYAVSGMETALFGLLLLTVVRFAEDLPDAPGWRPAAGLVAAGLLASLARPEGVVAFPLAALVLLWESRHGEDQRRVARLIGVAAIVFVAATAAYNAWRVSYFGEWLPTPFLSKGAEGASLVSGWNKNLHRYFLNWAYFSPAQGYLFTALLVVSFAGLRVARRTGVRAAGDGVAFVLGAVLCAVYLNFVDWMPGMRYHAPLAGLLLVSSRHLHHLLPDADWRAAAGRGAARFAAVSFCLLLAGVTGLSHLRHATGKMVESARLCHVPLAEWVRTAVPPGSLLAMADVGIVPYYTGLRTLDIHPESLTDAHIAKRAFSAAYVLARRPDVIVLSVRGVYSARMDPLHWELYKNEEFRSEYAFIGTVRNQWYEDRAYWVFVRTSHPVSDDMVRALPAGIGLQRRTRLDP